MKTKRKDFNDNMLNKLIAFKLPTSTGALFVHFGWEVNMVEPNQFVVNSLTNFIRNESKQLIRGDIQEANIYERINYGAYLPKSLIFELFRLSDNLGVSYSTIINEALGYSLPALIEIEQAQEDYMIEQAENIGNTNNTES